MPLCADVLVKEASVLPYAERAKLVDALLVTLDPISVIGGHNTIQ